jgi:4'-phosphopantetheinyl transferase
MPIYQTNNVSENIKVGVWKITESVEDLLSRLLEKGFDESTTYQTKNQQRLKQWLATRLLLNNYFDDASIIYNELGKPSIDNGWNISISHSNEFVAIILNKKEACGIDIEKMTPKIERIKNKFLSDYDLKTRTSLEHLTLYWGAKEALYKLYGKKEVLFIEHLFIEDFSNEINSFNGRIEILDFKKKVPMQYEIIEGYILTYTL